MVRKLYKHEFLALFKWIIPLNLICLCLSFVIKLNMEVGDSELSAIFMGITMFAFVLSAIAMTMLTFVIVISRFYKHLLSQEGYLTFTIPVSPVTHIVCKLVCGTVVTIVSALVLGLAIGVVTVSVADMSQLSEAVEYFFSFNMSYISTHRLIMLIVSYSVLGVLSTMHGLLFAYAAMALGQRSKKNRVASAVGWYFLINIGRNIITNIINIFCSVFTYDGEISEEIIYTAEEISMDLVDSMQIMSVFSIIETVIWGAIFFGITYHILTKKLNLE